MAKDTKTSDDKFIKQHKLLAMGKNPDTGGKGGVGVGKGNTDKKTPA